MSKMERSEWDSNQWSTGYKNSALACMAVLVIWKSGEIESFSIIFSRSYNLTSHSYNSLVDFWMNDKSQPNIYTLGLRSLYALLLQLESGYYFNLLVLTVHANHHFILTPWSSEKQAKENIGARAGWPIVTDPHFIPCRRWQQFLFTPPKLESIYINCPPIQGPNNALWGCTG